MNENQIDVLLSVEEEDENVNLNIEVDEDIQLNIEEPGGTQNYEELYNLPRLDGQKIIGDMHEKDPTVPEWAKDSTKPIYTYEEVGAIGAENQLAFEEIDRMFNAVFGI